MALMTMRDRLRIALRPNRYRVSEALDGAAFALIPGLLTAGLVMTSVRNHEPALLLLAVLSLSATVMLIALAVQDLLDDPAYRVERARLLLDLQALTGTPVAAQ